MEDDTEEEIELEVVSCISEVAEVAYPGSTTERKSSGFYLAFF